MKKFATRLAVYIIGSIIIDAVYTAIDNKKAGKTIFGNKPKSKKNTEYDARTNYIWLGTKDYVIEDAV